MHSIIEPLIKQAIDYFNNGKLENAEQLLLKVVKIHNTNSDALHILGVINGLQGRPSLAREHLSKAAKLDPNNGFIHFNLAKALVDLGENLKALAHHRKATDLSPAHIESWLGYGKCFADLGMHPDAIKAFKKAIECDPRRLESWYNLGIAQNEMADFEGALASYEQALSLNPQHDGSLLNKAVSLNNLFQHDEALACNMHALLLNPESVAGWSNKGITLNFLGQPEEALICYQKALSINPNHYLTWTNQAIALTALKRLNPAIAAYEKSLEISPNQNSVFGALFHLKMRICDWNQFDPGIKFLENQIINQKQISISPFVALGLMRRADQQLLIAQNWVRNYFPSRPHVLQISPKLVSRKKIRIGYFSPDFKNHAVSYLIAELIELHNKDQFEVFAFALDHAKANDHMRERIISACDHFIEAGNKSDLEIVSLARLHEIDIAIDLGGFTDHTRTNIFSHRVAPIQINYLGYPGTSGATYFDYLIGDPILIPKENQCYYSEKIIYMPDSFQANDSKREISDKKFTRHDFGLPNHGYIYCCFNDNYKITPEIFSIWMNILRRVDGSILWLLGSEQSAKKNLHTEASKLGIDSDRIIFGERLLRDEYLARYKLADLFLDTFPFNGGATASDCLWSGLPILTCAGEAFASRMAASLLSAIDLPELITNSLSEYETQAITFGLQEKKGTDIKNKLLTNIKTTPLFNSTVFTNNIEKAYKEIFKRHLNGMKITHLDVANLTNDE